MYSEHASPVLAMAAAVMVTKYLKTNGSSLPPPGGMVILLPQSLLSLFTDRLHGVIKIATQPHLLPAARGRSAAYGGSYSSVTSSGNIRNEIGVMRFPCNAASS